MYWEQWLPVKHRLTIAGMRVVLLVSKDKLTTSFFNARLKATSVFFVLRIYCINVRQKKSIYYIGNIYFKCIKCQCTITVFKKSTFKKNMRRKHIIIHLNINYSLTFIK